jgi:hypothetical protein
MTIMPATSNEIIPIIKITLHEKPAPIPVTPEEPATLDGSLHPSQAKSDGTKLVMKRKQRARYRDMELK